VQLRNVLAGLLGAAVCFSAVATSGVLPDFTARGSQPGLVHGLQTSANCQGCHSNGPLEFHYPATSWKGSVMANAGRDPVFWAALAVAIGAVLAMLLYWAARVPQANAHWIALMLPIHAAWAWMAWRIHAARD